MKKLIIGILTIALIMSMTVTAYAVTPTIKVPDVPEIPDISDNVVVGELPDEYWDSYFEKHPFTIDGINTHYRFRPHQFSRMIAWFVFAEQNSKLH